MTAGRVNEVVKYIYMIDNDLDGNKKGQSGVDSTLSCQVGVAGFEPAASTSQMWRDTGLRYTPSGAAKVHFINFAANLFSDIWLSG